MEAISKNKLIMAKTQPYDNSVIIFSRSSTNSEWEIEDEIKPSIDANQKFVFGTNLCLNSNGNKLYVEFIINEAVLTVIYNRDNSNKWSISNLEFSSLKNLNIE